MIEWEHRDKVQAQTTLGAKQRASLDQWQEATAALGLKFFPIVEVFGTDDRKRCPLTRISTDRQGKAYRYTPCRTIQCFGRKT